jgi:hypothetical protein
MRKKCKLNRLDSLLTLAPFFVYRGGPWRANNPRGMDERSPDFPIRQRGGLACH